MKKHGGEHREEPGRDPRRPLDPREPGRHRRPRHRGDPRPRRLRCRPSQADGDPDRTASYAVGTATSDGQRFRVLRPHAQGGLGAVFVALDAELQREVALEADPGPPRRRPRQPRRASCWRPRSPAGWSIPGIVPVYGLGTYGDGRPYYAMRFIRGDSLKEAIDRFHADEASKKRSRPAVAGAAQAAAAVRSTSATRSTTRTAAGVLHRDLKPGNIIVGKYGETLVVDWGLAKAAGQGRPGRRSGERTLVPSSASGIGRDAAGHGAGHAGVHEPGAGRGRPRAAGPATRRLQPGRHALLPADRPAAVRGRRLGAVLRARAEGRVRGRRGSSTRRSTGRWRRSA